MARDRSRDDDERDERDDDDRDSRRGRDEGRSRSQGRDRDDDDDDRRGSKKDDNSKTEVKLKNVRLSYEHIFRAASFNGDDGDDGGKPKFSASFIFDPETKEGKANLIACEDAIEEAKFKKWGNKQPKLRDDKIALRNDKDSEEYEGMYYVSASSTRRPKVFDIDGSTPLAESDGVIYSGCYVNAIVRFWAQDNKWGKRVNASLEGVQFLEDGEAFGAAGIGDGAFDDESGRKSSRSNGDGPRRRSRGDDDERGDRGRGGDRDRDRGRSRDRDDSDDRGSRSRSRDDDDRDSRRGRGDDDDRSSRRSRGRDDDEADDRRDRGRSRDDDSGDDDRRGRSRDRDDDRGSRSRRDLV